MVVQTGRTLPPIFPDLPKWGTIANIEASRYKKGTVYITVDLHQMGDFDAYAYKTEDYGTTWKLITDSMPKSVHTFAHVIKEDPKREGMLYLGVDNGIYISTMMVKIGCVYETTYHPLRYIG